MRSSATKSRGAGTEDRSKKISFEADRGMYYSRTEVQGSYLKSINPEVDLIIIRYYLDPRLLIHLISEVLGNFIEKGGRENGGRGEAKCKCESEENRSECYQVGPV